MGSHGKADAASPFVKSSFWRAVNNRMAALGPLGVNGRGHSEEAAGPSCATSDADSWASDQPCEDVLMSQSSGVDGALTLVPQRRAHRVLTRTCLQPSSSFVNHLPTLMDNTGGEDACRTQKKPE